MHNEISPHPFAAGSVSEPTQYWVDQAEINWMEARGAAAAENRNASEQVSAP
jgi:hypothetical protein